MRTRHARLVRLGAGAAATLALGLTACGDPASPSAPAATPSGNPSAPVRHELTATSGTTGSDGLTVRYLSDDGTVRTVRVEDFHR